MMFITVKNESDRAKLFREFQHIKESIKTDIIDRKLRDFQELENNTRTFIPITEAQNKTTTKISELLKENTVKNTPESEKSPKKTTKRDNLFQIIDKTFHFGSKSIEDSQGFNINGHRFPKTEGLIQLLSLKEPHGFTSQDGKHYKEILRAINWGKKTNGRLLSIQQNSSNPKIQLQRQVIDQLKNNREVPVAAPSTEKEVAQKGEGIPIILPGDIDSLLEKLGLLCGEFKAGNSAVRRQIIAILDNLHSRNAITSRQYNRINERLCT